ncbi:MAG: AzlC family ABC transporter permease [Clostridiales bacterium]|nr:AzlC family ABC transporter permease [Clostridiales bacterium]
MSEKVKKKGSFGYAKAFRAAFPYTIPVLTGYLFIGMAFGVMIQEKGYNFLWAMFMSLVCYAGSGQYLAVNFFVPGVSLLEIIFMEFMVNVRHIFYGLSLLERFSKMGRKRWYMIFSLTDETYSLLFITKTPEAVDESKFLFAIAMLDQFYWILGSGIGALLGRWLPIEATGIDFAMTALFVVIMVEQWMDEKKRPSACVGLGCALLCLLIFGAENFILPTMIVMMVVLLSGKRIWMEKKEEEHAD